MNTENNGTIMPVMPMGNGGLFGGGNGGNDFLSILVLFFLFMMMGGWGNGLGGYGAGGDLYPWMNQQAQMQQGFQTQALGTQIEGFRSAQVAGFGDVNLGIAGLGRQICETGSNIVGAVRDGFYGAEVAASQRQMAQMQQDFAMQSAFQQCCCENRLATAQTQNLVGTEGAATRLAIQNQTQQILDKMCEQEKDQLRAQNIALQNQVNMLNLAASQTAQTAQLIADNTAQTQYIVNRVAPYPIPAYTVANPVTPVTPTTGA